jgi:predicted unusual protein kinase regulating ubiquinone biosynthesis (AarF/ABC1/UbiB family)
VLVMERIHGVQISDIDGCGGRRRHPMLAENGVEIFFTQVFRAQLLPRRHAPGNIFVPDRRPGEAALRAVDFGIVGTLDPRDQHYLAENFLGLLRPRLPARRGAARRIRLGAARHARRRIRIRDPHGAASRSSTSR